MNKKLKVIMLVIGDEILNGRTKDLNGAFFTKFLFEIGAICEQIHFIKDQKETILNFIDSSLKTADVVITSGGIGPTKDDLTKEILAEYFGMKLIERSDVELIIQDNYQRFNRTWEKNLNFYHHFPEHFTPLVNLKGLAPGLAYFEKKSEKMIFSLPGVPREFQSMLTNQVLTNLKKYFPNKLSDNHQVVVRTFGIPEEKIFGELCPNLWEELEKFGKVSSLPHTIGIDIVVTLNELSELDNQKEKVRNIFLNSKLKDSIWNFGKESLEELILNFMSSKNLTVSTAESCTGGFIASKITNLSGSSKIFNGSVVSYANSIKTKILEIDASIIEQKGAVSLEVAELMAKNANRKLESDYCISTTGIAGPGGGSAEKPVGTVCIGIASKNSSNSFLYRFPGDRIRLKERFADMALLHLWQMIQKE